MTWCSYNTNTNDVMAPHSYVAQMEHERWCRYGDVVHTLCEPCDVTLGMHVSRACAIIKMGASKYSNSLAGMPADRNLGKITASHFKTLITQNANENMQDMFLIVYLNENLRYCNENSAWGKREPLIHPLTEFWHMAHFWMSYGRCTMPGSPMGRSEGLTRCWTG